MVFPAGTASLSRSGHGQAREKEDVADRGQAHAMTEHLLGEEGSDGDRETVDFSKRPLRLEAGLP